MGNEFLGTEMAVQAVAALILGCRGTFQMEIPVPESGFAFSKDSLCFSIFTSAGSFMNELRSQRISQEQYLKTNSTKWRSTAQEPVPQGLDLWPLRAD